VRSIGYFKSPERGCRQHGRCRQEARLHVDPAEGQRRRHDPEQLPDVEPDFFINGVNVKLAGLHPLAASSPEPSATDQQRAEVAASRWWRCCCSSCSAAWSPPACPAIIGGLTIGGALGILRLIAEFGPVHFFAQPVVTMIGLGIASTTACSS
jgi:RND superfamily putative drug exporter